MQNNLQQQIKDLLKEAIKNGDEVSKMTYRALLTSFMTFLVANNRKPQDTLTDEEVLGVIRKEIKKREDSILQFQSAGRPELAENEVAEKNILLKFLPTQLSLEEVEKRVEEILSKNEPLDPKMSGKYIGMCVKELKEVASGENIKQAVNKILSRN